MNITNISTRVVTITPDHAFEMLTGMAYEHQRAVRSPKVAYYVKIMKDGGWVDGSNIKIGFVAGKPYLLNGQHRLQAVFESGLPQTFTATEMSFENMDDLAIAYYNEDTGATRTISDAYKAVGLGEKTELRHDHQQDLGGAVRWLLAEFNYKGRGAGEFTREDILTAMLDWLPEMQSLIGIMAHGELALTRRILSGPVLSVALYTMRHAPERAEAFWNGVSHDTAEPGTGGRVLVKLLLTTRIRDIGQVLYMRRVTHCWNAAYAGRSVSRVQILDPLAPVVILGTPMGKK